MKISEFYNPLQGKGTGQQSPVGSTITEDDDDGQIKVKEKLSACFEKAKDLPGFVEAFKNAKNDPQSVKSIIDELVVAKKNGDLTNDRIVQIVKGKDSVTEARYRGAIYFNPGKLILYAAVALSVALDIVIQYKVFFLAAFGVCILIGLTKANMAKQQSAAVNSIDHKMFVADLQTEIGKITKITQQALMRQPGNSNRALAVQKHFIELLVSRAQVPAGPYDKRLEIARQIVADCEKEMAKQTGTLTPQHNTNGRIEPR